uniref:Uncharacterized protein n=1 Tax=Brassica oleracea TaxID=3712 RepID=A0A3P6ETD6_BRAOL|nr:unnamed protein product [Brassica oleracea]
MHIVPAEEVTQGTHMTFTDAKTLMNAKPNIPHVEE